jgi:hypothetical protein
MVAACGPTRDSASRRNGLDESPGPPVQSTGPVDRQQRHLGRKHLPWDDIESITCPKILISHSTTIVPATQRRKRQISVGTDQVKDVEGLATWLETLRTARAITF